MASTNIPIAERMKLPVEAFLGGVLFPRQGECAKAAHYAGKVFGLLFLTVCTKVQMVAWHLRWARSGSRDFRQTRTSEANRLLRCMGETGSIRQSPGVSTHKR